jgi:hypothetical protein
MLVAVKTVKVCERRVPLEGMVSRWKANFKSTSENGAKIWRIMEEAIFGCFY